MLEKAPPDSDIWWERSLRRRKCKIFCTSSDPVITAITFMGEWQRAHSRGSTEHELEVKNNSYSGSVRIAAELPDGWKTDSNQYDLELEAGQAEKMSFTLTTPDYDLHFWDYRDVDLPFRCTYREIEGVSRVPIRVFPVSSSVYAVGIEKNIMFGYPGMHLIAVHDQTKFENVSDEAVMDQYFNIKSSRIFFHSRTGYIAHKVKAKEWTAPRRHWYSQWYQSHLFYYFLDWVAVKR